MIGCSRNKEELLEAKDVVYELFKCIDDELFNKLMTSEIRVQYYGDLRFEAYVERYNAGKCAVYEEYEPMRVIDEKLHLSEQSNEVLDLIGNFKGLYKVLSYCDLTEFIDSEKKYRLSVFMNMEDINNILKDKVIKEIFIMLLENSSVKKHEASRCDDVLYDLYIKDNLNEIKNKFECVFKKFNVRSYEAIRSMLMTGWNDEDFELFFFDEIIPDYKYFERNTDKRLLDWLCDREFNLW